MEHDSAHQVVAFSVTRDFLNGREHFEGLPVVPFEDIDRTHPPEEYMFLAPLSPKNMNEVRKTVYEQIKAKGYRCVSYVSSRATVFADLQIGENCFVLEDNTIQPFVEIGDNVVLWSGNHIGHHSTIRDHVFVTSHVVISGRCVVEANSFIGVNATLRDGVRLGEGTLVEVDPENWTSQ